MPQTIRWTLALTVLACDADPPPSSASVPVEPVAAPPASAPIDPPPPAAPSLRPHGVAIVRSGATLRAGTSADAPTVRVADASANGFVVAAVGLQDGMVIVESAEVPHVVCARTLWGVSDFRLRWFVAPEDLASLTTRRVRVEYDDGTAVTLAPGVPLVADGDAWQADALGVKLRVAVPADAIDRFYERSDEPLPTPGVKLDPGLHKDGDALQYDHGRALPEDQLERSWDFEQTSISAWDLRERDGRRLVDVRSACAALTVVVSADRIATPSKRDAATALAEASMLGALLTASDEGSPALWRVAVGVDVRWRDGSVAGLVTREHDFRTAPTVIDGRKCFAIAPTDATIELCFAARDVQEIPAVEAPPLGPGDLGGLIGSGGSGAGGLGLGSLGGSGVKGSLDKDIIHRIVKAHRNEVRFCYEQGLAKHPRLSGKITVSFTIGPTGSVIVSKAKSSTLKDRDVDACIVKAVKRWKFPKPDGGGAVDVTYPFVLSSI
ncbi:MAG TPA: AgmX/PglI C-terminal domain-containing protein [Nannocystaceae bacterium]|nr:AgmX/PglI C-terminal domain-containing protein [Nannocystaceae bacterium]